MTTTANTIRKRQLIGRLEEGGEGYDILGYACWWNIREVRISQDRFAQMLRDCGLDDRQAREHNYRSAFKRALKDLEENRIIRFVDEDEFRMIYQFTAEEKVNGDGNPRLEYSQETLVTINKRLYSSSQDFEQSVKAREDIKVRLIELFQQHKTLYKSSDITRHLQRIFKSKADIISLRQQGSVYFVPASYKNVLDSVTQLVGMLGGACTLDRMPILNVQDSRQMIKNAFTSEMSAIHEALDAELDEVESGGTKITERWVSHRLREIKKVKTRIQLYSDVLADKADEMTNQFTNLEDGIIGARKLSL